MKNMTDLRTYLEKRGFLNPPPPPENETTPTETLPDTRADALTGDAQKIARLIVRIQTNNLKGSYNYDDNSIQFDAIEKIVTSVPENENFWTTSNYDTLWGTMLPKIWEKVVKNAWASLSPSAKVAVIETLSNNWVYAEIDIYEALEFSNAIYGNWRYGNQFPYTTIAVNEINNGDEKLVTNLKAILRNEAEIGQINSDIIYIALKANRSDLWEEIQKLLLAAQRQEGLRQTIIQAIDSAHRGAATLLLQTIIDHNLQRFVSVTKSLQWWFNLPLTDGEEITEKNIDRLARLAIQYLPAKELDMASVLEGKNYTEVYMQLWASIQRDDLVMVKKHCEQLMQSSDPQKRAIILYLSNRYYMGEKMTNFATKYYQDTDIMVRWNLFNCLQNAEEFAKEAGTLAFFEQLLKEISTSGLKNPKPQFSWENYQFDLQSIFRKLVYYIAPILKCYVQLLPYKEQMEGGLRQQLFYGHFQPIFEKINAVPKVTFEFQPNDFDRNWIVQACQDKVVGSSSVGFQLYSLLIPTAAEIPILQNLLTRISDDTRKNVLTALFKLDDAALQTSIQSLLTAKTEEQRLAALDMLQQLKKQNRFNDFVIASAKAYSQRKTIGHKAELILHDLLDDANDIFDESNGYGLYDPSKRADMPVLEKPTTGFFMEKLYKNPLFGLSVSVEKLETEIKKLDALIIANENYEYEAESWDKTKETILLGSGYIRPIEYHWHGEKPRSYEENLANIPLSEVWKAWFAQSGLTQMDLCLAFYTHSYPFTKEHIVPDWLRNLVKDYTQTYCALIFSEGYLSLKYPNQCNTLLGYLHDSDSTAAQEFYIQLDLTIHYFASIPKESINEKFRLNSYYQEDASTWREAYKAFFDNFASFDIYNDERNISESEFKKIWTMLYWYYRNLLPTQYQGFSCSAAGTLAHAHQLGWIGTDELYYLTLHTVFGEIAAYPHEHLQNLLKKYPIYRTFLDKAIPHFLNIELKRGDTPTTVSNFVQIIGDIKGVDYLIKIVKGLGKDSLNRGYSYSGLSKSVQFSSLLKKCHPSGKDTFEVFKNALDIQKFSEKRLMEVALYAPQWLPWMAKYIGWAGLESAAWCLHTHSHNYIDLQKESESAKYTTISAQDFQDGAVDVTWFKDAFAQLGAERWERVYEAAHYICDNQGYIRARIYADAILGKMTLEDCKKRIFDKRNKDYVVALGLIPLDAKDKATVILERYRILQTFKKQSKDFGQQRQASEKRVCDLALDNLARNAGYPDPVRLTWAMETLDVQEMLQRAGAVNIDGAYVQLQVTSLGKADVFAIKKEKTLANIPPAVKKNEAVMELIEIKNNLNAQYTRIKKSLEEAMIRGDVFQLSEIRNLMQHPVIKPLLQSLVLISGDKTGFYEENTLKNANSEVQTLSDNSEIRIAHCADLYHSGMWSAYQKQVFQQEIIQPFKQVFRELYLPTADELASVGISKRYEGYQVQTMQAAALLRGRGWSANYYAGLQKTYHRERILASVDAYADWFNAANNTEPTELHAIRFHHKNTGEPIALKDIPKAIFSEIMRDLDLVVSVAHVGGVDIEASLSSIELRAVIVEETAALFKLDNVRIEKNHIFIKGKKGDYTIHLGSGIAHKVPSQMLYITPVTTQARGRIFLPFVDEDPKTAEIVSKVLLLAKDDAIQDPTVLSQL